MCMCGAKARMHLGWRKLQVKVRRHHGRTRHTYRRSGLVISHERGLRYDAGLAVPVLMS